MNHMAVTMCTTEKEGYTVKFYVVNSEIILKLESQTVLFLSAMYQSFKICFYIASTLLYSSVSQSHLNVVGFIFI